MFQKGFLVAGVFERFQYVCFLSAFCYLSAGWFHFLPDFLVPFFFFPVCFLEIFAPLPLVGYGLQAGFFRMLAACLVNGLLVFFMDGGFSTVIFALYVGLTSLGLMAGMRRKKSLESIVFSTWLMTFVAVSISLLLGVYCFHWHPMELVQEQIAGAMQYLMSSMQKSGHLAEEVDLLKRDLLIQFPSHLCIFSFFLILSNVVFLVQWGCGVLRTQYGYHSGLLRKWRTPELWVWPTIGSASFLLFDLGIVSDIARNVFNFLMAAYIVQGLSILHDLFSAWNFRVLFRWILFFFCVSLMMPLVLGLGFFDLWFDFRKRLKQ